MQSRKSNFKKYFNSHEILKKSLDSRFLIYNRVPKCGSRSLTTLFYKLGALNKFHVTSPYEKGEKQEKNKDEEQKFVSWITSQSHPFAYIRHIYFVDFTRFQLHQPIYINFIRDPIERFESFYYFTRFGNDHNEGNSWMDDQRRNEDIDECVRNRRSECLNPYWQVVPYFCGNDPGCSSRSQWSVDKAKSNIVKNYLFVGLTEEFEKSLYLLEVLAPQFFANATKVYKSDPENQRIKNQTKTKNKKPTSEKTKKFLRQKTSLGLEYDLYEFVKKRFLLMSTDLLKF